MIGFHREVTQGDLNVKDSSKEMRHKYEDEQRSPTWEERAKVNIPSPKESQAKYFKIFILSPG